MRSTFIRVGLGALITVTAAAGASLLLATPASAQSPVMTQTASADASEGRWEGGAVRDLDAGELGAWRAYVTNGTDTEVFGRYATEREARRAGKAAAREKNKGVVAAPECEPPILC